MTTMTVNPTLKIQIPNRTYFKIGDVAELVGVKPYVLRYWESEFPVIHPQKSTSGQRVYRRGDVEMALVIKHLLHEERYSIEGAKKRLKELRKKGELKVFKEETVAQLAEIVEAGEDYDGFVEPSSESEPPTLEGASEAVTDPQSEQGDRSFKSELVYAEVLELKGLIQRPIQALFRY